MLLMYFTERTYYHAPEDEIVRNRGFFGLPNRFHDAHKAADLYNMYRCRIGAQRGQRAAF